MADGTKLVIVESPTKAKKIQGYLGKDYTVLASVGHIRDLAQPSQVPASRKEKYGRFGVDIEDGFKPYYIIDPGHRKTVSQLRKALSHASELYLATDEDREGEAIAWHLVQTLKPTIPVKRMVFHEITKPAILDSLNHTRQVDQNMVNAQETRRVLDRLYGYELSPVLWRKVGPKLSAGRVQSVATKLVVEREKERMAFVPATYRDLIAHLDAPHDSEVPHFDAHLTGVAGRRLAVSRDFDEHGKLVPKAVRENPLQLSAADAHKMADELTRALFTVGTIEQKAYTRHPGVPFTTSTLQQAAGNRLSMSSRVTMRAAQTLYENGFITYMRTDSIILSNEGTAAARKAVADEYGEKFLSARPRHFANHEAGVQEAHECIRPSGSVFRRPDEIASRVSPTELRLYTLIWQRTLATQMAPATGSTQTIHLTAPTTSGDAEFQASGTVITFPGFLRVWGNGQKSADDRLPQLTEGSTVSASSVEPVEHETQPPARYTEASLVKTLEAKEIGRPSTYASIISTIIDRGYVYEKGRAMIPSWLAFSVTKLLEKHFSKLVDYQFTAQMEKGLDEIARGKESELDWLTRFYFGTGKGSASSKEEAEQGLQQQVSELGDIDARSINTIDIGDGVHVRVGRYGPYVEDTKNVDAQGTPQRASVPPDMAPDELTAEVARKLIRQNASGGRVLGTDSNGNTIEVRVGRFGPYVERITPEMQAERTAAKTATAKTSRSSRSTRSARATRPQMASLFKSMTPETVTLEQAEKLLSLPRLVGTYEAVAPASSTSSASTKSAKAKKTGKTGETEKTEKSEKSAESGQKVTYTVEANNGRYGPYLTRTVGSAHRETRSLSSEDQIFTVTLEQAKEMFAQPKYRRGRSRTPKPPLRVIGKDPETGAEVTIKDGFYGTYITDGTTNRTLPRQFTVQSITPEDAYRLLAEKRAQGPRKPRRRTSTRRTATRKTPARTTSARKTTRRTTTRAASQRTTKRTTTRKSSTTKSAAKK